MLALLDHAARFLDHHLGAMHVALRRFVEGGGNDLSLRVAAEIGDLFRAFVDQDSQSIILGGYGGSRLIDGLVDNGFVTMRPNGAIGSPARPSVQLATRGLSPAFDTLCLLGDTPAAVRACIQAALAPRPATAAPPTFGAPQTWGSSQPTTVAIARGVVGNNSYVNGMAFDSAGNLFLTTWGHGDNLYSLAPDGTMRFHRFLPEMGTINLRTAGDEIFVYTRAGARLYRLKPDGTPVWQAQLNQDPGSVHYRDNYGLSTLTYSYLPKQKLIIHRTPRAISRR
jgi:hypothetical protein